MTQVALPQTEAPKTKTHQDFQNEYAQLCAKAGSLQYQIYAYQRDLDKLNEAILALNLEAAKVQAEEKAKLQAEASEPAKETA